MILRMQVPNSTAPTCKSRSTCTTGEVMSVGQRARQLFLSSSKLYETFTACRSKKKITWSVWLFSWKNRYIGEAWREESAVGPNKHRICLELEFVVGAAPRLFSGPAAEEAGGV